MAASAFTSFAQSAQHLFRVTYGAKVLRVSGGYAIDYRGSEYSTEEFAIEYFLLDVPADLNSVIDSQSNCLCNVNHAIGDDERVKADMQTQHSEATYWYTAQVQRCSLPAPITTTNAIDIRELTNKSDVTFVQQNMANSERPMPEQGYDDAHIKRFYAIKDDKAVAWAQMIYDIVPNVAYVGEMFTLPDYRKQGIAKALLERIHNEAHEQGCADIVLVPSYMAMNFYTQFGYRTTCEFSVFHVQASQ